jgi:hypothetical protein
VAGAASASSLEPPSVGVARDVEQILDRDGQAFQGRACQAGRAQPIAGAGFGQGLLGSTA